MKRLTTWILASVALALAVPALAERQPGGKTRVVPREASTPAKTARVEPKAGADAYSAQVNIVTRVQGTAFFRTAIDITNNTDVDGVIASVQYCYTVSGGFAGCTPPTDITLLSFFNFHTDDIIDYLGSLGVVGPDAQASSFGTLLVTFDGVPSAFGWEGTVTARTYSAYQDNPANGTLAIAYPGSLFFESANTTLVGTIRDTHAVTPTPAAGALRTNLGITNTDLNGTGPVDVDLSFFDVTEGSATNGQRVGNIIAVDGIQSGEVRPLSNIWSLAAIPSSVTSVIVFADVVNPTSGFPTIEGYANILSAGTQDGAYFELKCADTDFCGN